MSNRKNSLTRRPARKTLIGQSPNAERVRLALNNHFLTVELSASAITIERTDAVKINRFIEHDLKRCPCSSNDVCNNIQVNDFAFLQRKRGIKPYKHSIKRKPVRYIRKPRMALSAAHIQPEDIAIFGGTCVAELNRMERLILGQIDRKTHSADDLMIRSIHPWLHIDRQVRHGDLPRITRRYAHPFTDNGEFSCDIGIRSNILR